MKKINDNGDFFLAIQLIDLRRKGPRRILESETHAQFFSEFLQPGVIDDFIVKGFDGLPFLVDFRLKQVRPLKIVLPLQVDFGLLSNQTKMKNDAPRCCLTCRYLDWNGDDWAAWCNLKCQVILVSNGCDNWTLSAETNAITGS